MGLSTKVRSREMREVPDFYWQEWRDSNPQPPVLETGALAIELHSWGAPQRLG